MMLQLGTALGLKPDISNYKLKINFCCLLAKYYNYLDMQVKDVATNT